MFSLVKECCNTHKVKAITFIDTNCNHTFIKPEHIDTLSNENIISFRYFNMTETLFVYCETEFDRTGMTKENWVPY